MEPAYSGHRRYDEQVLPALRFFRRARTLDFSTTGVARLHALWRGRGRTNAEFKQPEAGRNIETIRYYEQIGLMPAPKRSEGGYRLYGETERRWLRFILRGRELGFSIDELRSLLNLVDGGHYTCGEVRDLAVQHLKSVRAKISDLCRLEWTLAEVSAQCEGSNVPDCPVIDALFDTRS